MKHLNQYKNDSFDLKALPSYITEYIVKKKLDKPIDSEDHYEYFPKTREELVKNIKELIKDNRYNFNCIDTSEITDMSNLFADIYTDKNFDVSKWDVGNVTNMSYMFFNCEKFDCDLSSWDVSNVTDMTGMFDGCESFEGKGIENWDVSNVENVEEMFAICSKLNIDFSNWKLKKIYSTKNIFYNCEQLKGKGLDKWDVSNIVDMRAMFEGCSNLDFDLSNWNVSKVKYIQYMFYNCENFTGKGLENWDVNNISNMLFAFANCKKLNCDNVKNWKVNDNCNISGMFTNCSNKPDWYKEKSKDKRNKYTL